MADQTIVIEVVSEFKDNASSGLSHVKHGTDQASDSVNRFHGRLKRLQRQVSAVTGGGGNSGAVGGGSMGIVQKLKAINAEARRLNSGGGSFLTKIRNFGQAIKNVGSGGSGNVLKTLGGFAKKGLTIPIKILDKATSPLRRLYRGLTSFRGIVTGMAANWAFQKGIINPIQQADQLTNAKTFFAMKFGGAKQANSFMKDIYAFDKRSPYDTQQIIQVAKTMLGYGWSRKNVLRDLGTIEDAAAAHGAGNEGVAGIMRQLAQTKMRLKPSQEDINVLNGYGVDAWKYIAEGLGLKGNAAGKAKAREMVQAKGSNVLSGSEATDMILKGLRRDFNGAAQKQVEKTASGMLDKVSGELNTKLVVPWGQGLQKGAIKGLKVIDKWIDNHEGLVDKFGQKLKKVSQTASVSLANMATKTVNRLSKTVGSKKFKKADFAGKVNMVETAVFGKNGIQKAAAQFGEYSAKYGGKIGLGIAKGFAKGVMSLIKDMLTALPGGKKTSPTAKGSALTLGILGASGLIKAGLGLPALKLGLKGIGKLSKFGFGRIKDYAKFSKNWEENMTRYGSFRKYRQAQKAARAEEAARVEKTAKESRSVRTLRGGRYDEAHGHGETVTKGTREAAPVRATKFRRLGRSTPVVEEAGGVVRESRVSRFAGRAGKVVEEAGSAGRGAGVISKLAGASKVLGKIATPLAILGTGIHLATAKNKTKAASEEAGGWAGALAGGKLGAMAGTAVGGPLGTLIGALGGGALGMFGGGKLGKWAGGKISKLFGGSSKADPLRNLLGLGKGSKTSEKAAKSSGKGFSSAGKAARSAGKSFKSAGRAAKSGAKGFKSAGKAAKSGAKGFKSAGKAAKSGAKGFKSAGKAAKSAGKGFKSAGRAAKSGSKGFKSAGRAAKSASRGFKSAGRAAKSGSRGFKTAGRNAKSAGTKFKSAGNSAKSAGSKMKAAAAKVQSLGTKSTAAGAKLTAMGAKASSAASNLSSFASAVSSIASAASGLASKIASIHIPSSIGKGHARGTSSAAPGIKLVGEEGPELLEFRGGEKVYTAAQTRHMLRRAGKRGSGAGGVNVTVGAINISTTGDAEGFEKIVPQLSNRIAHEVAKEVRRSYQNTPTKSA
jgi:tape measure domain-containing protein